MGGSWVCGILVPALVETVRDHKAAVSLVCVSQGRRRDFSHGLLQFFFSPALLY